MLRRSIQNKIFFTFATLFSGIFLGVLLIFFWQMAKGAVQVQELLQKDQKAQSFALLEGHQDLIEDTLQGVKEEVGEYLHFLSDKSPLTRAITRQQVESIASFLQGATPIQKIDFTLIFDTQGQLMGASAGERGYRPGDLLLPGHINDYEYFPSGPKTYALLQQELSLAISPLQAMEQDLKDAADTFVFLPDDIVNQLTLHGKIADRQGAIAVVESAIIRDDFSTPIGIAVVGKLLTNIQSLFAPITKATNAATLLYLDSTPLDAVWADRTNGPEANRTFPNLTPADVDLIKKQTSFHKKTLSSPAGKYLAQCRAIALEATSNIGIICSALSFTDIEKIQKLNAQHIARAQKGVRNWFLFFGVIILVITILAARLISTGITGPLEQIIRFTSGLKPGDLSARLHISAKDEIGLLGQSINGMLDALEVEVNEREKLEGLLRQAAKLEAIGTLAGGIAHDFNNILTVIIGYTRLAMSHAPKESKFAGDLSHVLEASYRAKNLVEQILTFSRQTPVTRIPLQILPLIKEELKMLRASLPSTITIKTDLDPNCGMVLADPTEIHQIVMNLCTNAYHALEKTGGTIQVRLAPIVVEKSQDQQPLAVKPGEYLELVVKDNGTGITPHIMDNIFDPYFTTKEQGKGTGMGLSIIHGIVQKNGGSIRVNSESGKGTTFYVYLPVVHGQTPYLPPDQSSVRAGKERIFLVDDEQTLAHMLKEQLEPYGYQVTFFTDSLEALAAFEKNPNDYDIVITDQTMPGMTGTELSRKILAINPDMPIILCTGYSSTIDETSIKEIGIQRFVMKPITEERITQLIRECMDGS